MSTSSPTAVADRARALAGRVRGAVLDPGHPDYEAECRGYNLAVTHRPRLVVVAEDADDVAATVRFAAEEGLAVAVMATGHHAAAPVTRGVLLVTRRMDAVEVDPVARRATVGAGARWGQVVEAAARHGLAPLAGSSPLVGVVGYTLGGGLSPTLGRRFGWAAEHVTAAELVTADGERRRVTAEREPDLLWGLRGGGAGLGVVTRLEFGLVPVERLHAGGLHFDGRHAPEVLRAYARLAAAAPEALSASVALLRLPPIEAVPEPLRGRLTVHVRVALLGSAEEGEALLADLRATAPTLIDTVRDMPFAAFAEIHADPVDPAPFVERSALLTELTEAGIDTLLRHVGPGPGSPVPLVELRQLGGALAREDGPPAAVAHRDAGFALWTACIGMPGDVADAVRHAEGLIHDLGPWATGRVQRNFLGHDRPEAAAHDPEAWRRLQTLRRLHDPAGTFSTSDHPDLAA